jgi:hypothetical protein
MSRCSCTRPQFAFSSFPAVNSDIGPAVRKLVRVDDGPDYLGSQFAWEHPATPDRALRLRPEPLAGLGLSVSIPCARRRPPATLPFPQVVYSERMRELRMHQALAIAATAQPRALTQDDGQAMRNDDDLDALGTQMHHATLAFLTTIHSHRTRINCDYRWRTIAR